MSNMRRRHICPRCGWDQTRPSMQKGFFDGVFRAFLLMPIRCRKCRNRFYRLRSGWPRFAISAALMLLLMLSAAIALLTRSRIPSAGSNVTVTGQGDADRQRTPSDR